MFTVPLAWIVLHTGLQHPQITNYKFLRGMGPGKPTFLNWKLGIQNPQKKIPWSWGPRGIDVHFMEQHITKQPEAGI